MAFLPKSKRAWTFVVVALLAITVLVGAVLVAEEQGRRKATDYHTCLEQYPADMWEICHNLDK